MRDETAVFDELIAAFLSLARDTEYDPDQKRADDGEWTDEGGGGGGGSKKVKPATSDEYAKRIAALKAELSGLNTTLGDLKKARKGGLGKNFGGQKDFVDKP
jgi:hypothetical protein